MATLAAVLDRAGEFDIIHSHLEWYSAILARAAPVPVVATYHGRLDMPWYRENLSEQRLNLVAISNSQASVHPDLNWTVVHNGLTLNRAPFERRRGDGLCFVGRVEPEKGILDALEIARRAGRPLRIAAKVGTVPHQRAYYEDVFKPALEKAGRDVEFLGEVSTAERDTLLAESYASLMPASWPEPFGLTAIESLACGTPVIARRVGALPEIIRHGSDGFFGDDVAQMVYFLDRVDDLDRGEIRRSVLSRFSAAAMVDGYEALYERVTGTATRTAARELAEADGRAARDPAATRRSAFRTGTGARLVPVMFEPAPVRDAARTAKPTLSRPTPGRGATSGDRARD
jgi:glycosyltransferase involved in cell wall biosynthesis